MRRSRLVRIVAAVAAVTLGTAAAACDLNPFEEFEFHCPQPVHPGLAIAVGVRANSPAPTLPREVRQLVADAMTGCGRITVVRVDGRPSVVGAAVFSSGARTEQNFEMDQASFLEYVGDLIAGAAAQEPEADVLGALSLAAAGTGPGGTVVLIDSGIQTTGALDFRTDDLPTRRPEAIADALRQAGLLPDLAGRSVVLSGLGYTAPPQDALDERGRAFVRDLWREIVVAAGAEEPVVVAEANTGEAAVSSPAVSVVEFPRGTVDLDCDASSVLPDDGAVGFVPDEAEFRDPVAAREVLNEFARFLIANPAASATIEGYVAHYGDRDSDLSQRRADRVREELVALGVRNEMTAVGRGWGPEPHPTAPPDPRYDPLNRRVVISIHCD